MVVKVLDIVGVSHNKSKVFLSNQTSFILDNFVIAEFSIIKDRSFSISQFDNFCIINTDYPHLKRIIQALSKYTYSTYEIIKKLEKKGVKQSNISLFINILENNKLIDDRKYTQDLIDYYVFKGKGKKYIQKVLQRKNLDKTILDNYTISEKTIIDNINKVILKVSKNASNLSKLEFINHIYSKLIRDGFTYKDFTIISKHQLVINYREEDAIIKSIEKYRAKNYDLASIYNKLLNRRFPKDLINKYIKGVKDDIY